MATHRLQERVTDDGDLAKETKAYIAKAEQLKIEHCWECPHGEICDDERSYLDLLRKQASEALTGVTTQQQQPMARFDLDKQAEEATLEWLSLFPQRDLGWSNTKTDDEKRRFRICQSRKLWDEQVN